MQLWITEAGTIRCLYDDVFPLAEFGPLQITRASQVEPDAQGQWWADLGPVAGPRLGPFPKRQQALTAEADWLIAHHLPTPLTE